MKCGIKHRIFIFILLGIATLSGQSETTPIERIAYRPVLGHDYNPFLLAVAKNNDIYLVDPIDRRLALLKSTGGHIIVGGFGNTADSFFEPVDLVVNNLEIILCDRSGNRLLRYDLNLNFIADLDLEQVYPDEVEVDSWGNYFLLTRYNESVVRLENPSFNLNDYIDLRLTGINSSCWSTMGLDVKGMIAILDSCNNRIHTFNRFGRAEVQLSYTIDEPAFMVPLQDSWLLLNASGQWQTVDRNGADRSGFVDIENATVRQITSDRNRVYILTDSSIIIIRFA